MQSEAARKKSEKCIEKIDKHNKRLGIWAEYKEVLLEAIATALDEFAAARAADLVEAGFKNGKREAFMGLERLLGGNSLYIYQDLINVVLEYRSNDIVPEKRKSAAPTLQATVEQAEKEIGYGE